RRCRRFGGLDHCSARSGRCPKNHKNKRQRTSSSISATSSARHNLQELNIEPSPLPPPAKLSSLKVSSISIPRGNPCNKCSTSGVYNPEYPHSSARSSLCRFHKLDIDGFLANELNLPSQRCVKKSGMTFIFAEDLSNNTCTAFSTVVTEVVDYLTVIFEWLNLRKSKE
ncbi:hypothetical protein CU098_010336, partial [Rhizopus stolonifer]